MPAISELPGHQPLNGAEAIAIVQDGETRHCTISDVLTTGAGPVTARIVFVTPNGGVVNTPDVTLIIKTGHGWC